MSPFQGTGHRLGGHEDASEEAREQEMGVEVVEESQAFEDAPAVVEESRAFEGTPLEEALDALRHNRIHARTTRAKAQPRRFDPRHPEPYERYTTEVPTRARGHLSLSEVSLVD